MHLPMTGPAAEELNRIVYFRDEETDEFWVENTSIVNHLRTTAEQLDADGHAARDQDRELEAAGLLGAAHLIGTIADQLALLPLHDDLDSGNE